MFKAQIGEICTGLQEYALIQRLSLNGKTINTIRLT